MDAKLLLAVVLFAKFGFAQTVPRPGNEAAARLAEQSPVVKSAYKFLLAQARQLKDRHLRAQTLDVLSNPHTCVIHRAGLDENGRKAILDDLEKAQLIDDKTVVPFPDGLMTGVFPPLLKDGTSCPELPQPFLGAPGSSSGSHHSYPGGLAVHEATNERADIHLASEYRDQQAAGMSELFLDQDIIAGAPLWHDWAKTFVFQWNADGTIFPELSIAGTGAHHILGLAEAMKRQLPVEFVIAQASAHSSPTNGNEGKVVNWLRAAAIIARIDPERTGYLAKDRHGHFRLPAVRHLGDFDLQSAGKTNFLAEYALHNLSDADYTFSVPSVESVEALLAKLAPQFGYQPADTARYNNGYRNVVLSYYTAERLYILYSNNGVSAVEASVRKLREGGLL